MTEQIQETHEPGVSSTHFYIAVVLAVVFAIGLAIAVNKLLQGNNAGLTSVAIENGKPVPNGPDLTKFLEGNKFNITLHINDSTKVKVVGPDGVEQMVCGILRKGRIFPVSGKADSNCPKIPNKGIPLSSLDVKSILTFVINPTCTIVGGKLRCKK